ncbi:MAG: hypothetical protein HQ579_08480 [Candidatus Omnitrophica bacterium]|nr:hypothetical protein [Candidatus Omnitrophota bacterium]
MENNKCKNCIEQRNCSDSFASWIFFIVGLVAAIAIRAVTLLEHVDTLYSKIAWYVGVSGFFLFFIYKYSINMKRSRFIREKELLKKMETNESLSSEDTQHIRSILCAISSKKETLNYLIIFILSAIAIVFALYMDFFRKG